MIVTLFQERLLATVGDWFLAAAEWKPPPRARDRLLLFAVALFLGVTVVAILRLPPLRLSWQWAVAATGVASVTLLLNAVEYWLAGRWLNVDIGSRDAVRVSILASAANLAPVPGAVLVRARDLYSREAERDSIVRALATIGAGWVAVSLLASAISLLAAGLHEAAAVAFVLCVLATAILPAIAPPANSRLRIALQCLAVETMSVTAQTIGFIAIFRALGLKANLFEVLCLPLAGALASALGFFPGGLGLRELLAAGLAEMVGLSAATGALGSAVDRIIGLATLSIAGLLLLLRDRVQKAKSGSFERH